MKNITSLLVIVTGLGMSPAWAAESSDGGEAPIPGAPYPMAEQGADLAQMWCNACHVTGTGRTESAMDAAPPFAKLAPLVAANPDHYRTFLTKPHGPMKEITLSRDEIEALLTYISSLTNQSGGE